jgi:hypothetical protein
MTVDARTGEQAQVQLAFSKPAANSTTSDAPGTPPTLKTGEDMSAVSRSLVLPIAARPLDYLAVKFDVLSGRRYVATIGEPFFITSDKDKNLVGWGGGTIAEALGFF